MYSAGMMKIEWKLFGMGALAKELKTSIRRKGYG